MRVSSHPATHEWNNYDWKEKKNIYIYTHTHIWIIHWILGFFDIGISPNLFISLEICIFFICLSYIDNYVFYFYIELHREF